MSKKTRTSIGFECATATDYRALRRAIPDSVATLVRRDPLAPVGARTPEYRVHDELRWGELLTLYGATELK